MNDLDPAAQLTLLVWVAPFGLAAGLTVASIYRALSAPGRARTWASAAAIALCALMVVLAFGPPALGLLGALALLGLGAWAGSVILAPTALLWTEAIVLPVALILTWLLL